MLGPPLRASGLSAFLPLLLTLGTHTYGTAGVAHVFGPILGPWPVAGIFSSKSWKSSGAKGCFLLLFFFAAFSFVCSHFFCNVAPLSSAGPRILLVVSGGYFVLTKL